MNEARYLIKVPGGGQGGPYTAEQVQTFVASNQIPPGAQVIDIMASSPVAPPPGAPQVPSAPVQAAPAAPVVTPAAPNFDPSFEAGFADSNPAPAAPQNAPAPDQAMDDGFLDLIEVAPAPVPLQDPVAPAPAQSSPRPATGAHQRRPNTTRIKNSGRAGRRSRTGRSGVTSNNHLEDGQGTHGRRKKKGGSQDDEGSGSIMPIVLVVLGVVVVAAIIGGIMFYGQSGDDDLRFQDLIGQWHIDTARLEDHTWFRQTAERDQERLRADFALETFTFSAPNAVMAHIAGEARWQRAEAAVRTLRAQSLELTITPYDNSQAGSPLRWQIGRGQHGLSLDRDGQTVPLTQGPSAAFVQPAPPAADPTPQPDDVPDDDQQEAPDDQDNDEESAPDSAQVSTSTPSTPAPERVTRTDTRTTIEPQAAVAAEAFEALKGPWRLDQERFYDTNYYNNTNNALLQEDDGRQVARLWRSRMFATTYVFSEQHLDETIGTRRITRARAVGAIRLPGTDLPAWQVDVEDSQGRRRSVVLMITGDDTMTLQVRAGRGLELTLRRGEAPQEMVDTFLELEQ